MLLFTTSMPLSISAIMVSGGWYWNSKLTSAVDIFIPSTGEVCSFTPLPWMMIDHTQQGMMICGGVADCPVTHFLSQSPGQCHINLLQREGDLNLGNQVQELCFFMDMVILPNRQN